MFSNYVTGLQTSFREATNMLPRIRIVLKDIFTKLVFGVLLHAEQSCYNPVKGNLEFLVNKSADDSSGNGIG